MNREILFRGKRVDNGEWVEGYYVCTNSKRCFIKIHELITVRACNDIFEVIPETIGQYTGLTDKNGRRIFEGDIVKYKGKIYEIRYFIPQARFLAILPNGMFNPAVFLNCEVIGNIHDNPELLGGDKNA